MTPFPRVRLPEVSDEATAEVDALVEAAKTERDEARRAAFRRFISLHRKGKHIYTGTVPAHVIAQRRAKAKAAKASRRANR